MHLPKISAILVILLASTTEAGFVRTLTKLVQRIDSILRPMDNDVPQMAARHGYKVETHRVTTEDGYVLSMHRIPRGRESNRESNSSDAERLPAVYIQHGLTSSSADWLVSGPDKALGYVLAENGYDVWLGNYRGNMYSRKHLTLNPDSLWNNDYWQFSWDQCGEYDIPAMLDYVRNVTGQDKVQYIGFSMGTTGFMAAMNEHPDIAGKVKMAHLLAPVAYLGHMEGPSTLLRPFIDIIEGLLEKVGYDEWAPNSYITNKIGRIFCQEGLSLKIICSNAVLIFGGYDKEQLNVTLLPEIAKIWPAGASTKMVAHYGKNVRSGKFSKFDFGPAENLEVYGQEEPPEYKLEKVTVPVATYRGLNDMATPEEDYKRLLRELPNLVDNYTIPWRKYTHSDFQYAIDNDKLLFPRLLSNMGAAEENQETV